MKNHHRKVMILLPLDVTDQAYPEMVNALKTTHKRLFDIHSGKVSPVNKLPEGKIRKDE